MKKQPNAFLQYLENSQLYEKIKMIVLSWCKGNKDILMNCIKGYKIDRIVDIDEDITLDFLNVWIESKEGAKVEFDIAIDLSADVEGVSGKYHDHDSYTSRLWIMVSCSGSLDKRLNDLYIFGVDEFNKSKPKKPLDGDFKPYIQKKDYNEYANDILERYYFKNHPEAKINPTSINMDELANEMGLRIQNTSISEDRSIFGQIFFADAEVEIYDSENKVYEKRLVNRRTILVDSEAAYLRSFGSRNMTIAHECVHFYYHRKAFLFARMINEKLRYIQCQVNGKMKNAESSSTADWMEIQANALAPCILMPKESFILFANELFEKYNQFTGIGLDSINRIIDELAHTYEVTVYAARKRLIDLGFEQAIGAYNWVDDHYVRPYSFKKESLAYNETYTVSYKDVYKKVLSNQDLMMPIFSNQYVFVENHFCINHPDYIEKDANGNLILSDYALSRMDECCVKFKFITNNGICEDSDFGLTCYLNRDISKELEFDLEISGVVPPRENGLFYERYKIHSENVSEVMKAIAGLPFGEIVDYILKYLDISVKEIEIDSGLSDKTIRRYITGKNTNPDKRSVVAILRALNLPPRICEIALQQAGITFRTGHDEDDALYNVLMNLRNASADDANNFMESLGFKTLTENS